MTPDLFGRPGSYPACPRGDCQQGDSCDCATPIQSVESEHPWLWLLYAVGIVAGIVGSVFWPQPFGG